METRALHFRDPSVWAMEMRWHFLHRERRGITSGAHPKRQPSWARPDQLREWKMAGRRRLTRPATPPASSRKKIPPVSGPAADFPSLLRGSTPTHMSQCTWHAVRRPLQRRCPSSGVSGQPCRFARPGRSSSPWMGSLPLQQRCWAEALRAPRLRAFGAPGALLLRSRVPRTA